MKAKQTLATLAVVLAGCVLVWIVWRTVEPATVGSNDHGHGHGHGHEEGHGHGQVSDHGADEAGRGPHGGRLLEQEGFSVEIVIFERGVPPRFHVYAYRGGEALPPGDFETTLELARFGGRTDVFKEFQVEQDHGYRRSTGVVEEPHSFDVQVEASHAGRTYEWSYTSYEGRVELASEAVAEAGIGVEVAGPRWMAETVTAYGRIAPNENRMAFVTPRYAGTVREVHKLLGDAVKEGEVLASVESNESLRPYEVRAPISGSIIEKNVAAGEFVDQTRPIYKVADLGTVWVELNVYAEDASRLESGQRVVIRGAGQGVEREGRISYLSPFGTEQSQTTLVRVELENAEGRLRPGLFVTGAVELDRVEVPVAVRTEALQTFRDWEVVFVKEGGVFQAMPVVTGRRGGGWIEIVSGIEAGQEVATTNSFVLKADLLKSGATHDH